MAIILRFAQNEFAELPQNKMVGANCVWYTIWDDVRTYLTVSIDPQEKSELILAIAHFKNKH